MVGNAPNVTLIAGPSHVARWRWHVRDGVVDSPLEWDRFIGLGGAPIWHASILRQSAEAAGAEGDIAVLVGDFRIGNGILLEDPVPSASMMDGFLGIAAGAMSPEGDRAMLQHGLAGMRAWHETFGARARYVLWSAFCRQVQDRLAGRHIADGPYRHPVFNYDEIVAALPELDIIDLAPLLRLPMHEVQRLFIDDSSHPSQIGYLLLNGLIFDRLGVLEAYDRAVATVEGKLLGLAQKASESAGRPVLVTGRSAWLDTLSRYMGANGAQRLADAGLILAPLDRVSGQPSLTQIVERTDLARCAVVIVSAGGKDISALLARAFRTGLSIWTDVPVIDWESATEKAIRDRRETPRFARLDHALHAYPGAIKLALTSPDVEQGPLGTPSWSGVTSLLQYLLEAKWAKSFPVNQDWKIENGVLITRDRVAFLAGGSQQPLAYATGELRPSETSLRAFSTNIEARAQHAELRDIPYAHVVFPDKPSVQVEDFPFHPVIKLGETYVNGSSKDATERVIYPATILQATKGACVPLDTHLSDTGFLAVLRPMLDAVGIDASSALAAIESRIVKTRRWAGDLGGKLDPQQFQEALILDPDWELTELNSGGGFNDGMVDILLSPDAPVDRTVLLFGDSSFRMMLRHLSGVFTRIVCLRTRFYHREIVELIEPDIIFTGNAERYLAQVDSDDEAIPFMLYRPLRGIVEQFDSEFLKAWQSVTSPRAPRSSSYFEQVRAGQGYEARS